jgi:hypothetical protein
MRFSVDGDCRAILSRLFESDQNGHLRLGWSAVSLTAAGQTDLLVRPIAFRDYVMEGFVTYSVSAIDLMPGCLLSVYGGGSNRDRHIPNQIRHYITAAGFSITAEST